MTSTTVSGASSRARRHPVRRSSGADAAARAVEALGRSPLGRSGVGRAIAADPRWLLPLVLVGYVLYVTWTWEFPNWQGIPFPPVWVVATLAGLAGWRRLGRELAPIPVAAIVALAAMVLTDVTLFWTQGLRDFELYVKAGERWLAGAPVYTTVPIAARPDDLSNYPFLYPPLTLPLFGALSVLPFPLSGAVWVAVSLAAALAAFRCIGLGWRWSLLLLAWPPTAQGLYVGNVAVPLFVLFAAAVVRPAMLAIPPIFKIHSGLATLWLLRREHWRSLAMGAAGVLILGLATLPITGLRLWTEWLTALQAYQVSQRLLPQFLYGFGLARYVPTLVVLGLGLVVTVVALRTRARREQLARLGVATVVASPSLFAHGWLVTLPAAVRLHTPWFWLVLGLTACSPGPAWFVALGIVAASWAEAALRRRPGDDPWHPLGAARRPWQRVAHGERRAPDAGGRTTPEKPRTLPEPSA